jgi:hypothetical protein
MNVKFMEWTFPEDGGGHHRNIFQYDFNMIV